MILGAADNVTKQQFTELENGIYDRMKDVNELARNIQSDQISFLNTTLATFLAIAGLIAVLLVTLYTTANIRIKKASEMIEVAKNLGEEADNKLADLERKQEHLENVITSKELNEKLDLIEKLEKSHSKMILQERINLMLNQASRSIDNSKKYFSFVDTDPEEIKEIVINARNQEISLEVEIEFRRMDATVLVAGTGVNEEKLIKSTESILQKAIDLELRGKSFEAKYRRSPDVTI